MDSNAVVISLIAGALIPILTGLVTKLQASPQVKALVNVVVAAAVAVLVQVNQTGQFDWQSSLMLFATTLGASLGTYHGVYKPVNGNVPLAKVTANFGLGSTVKPDAPLTVDAPVEPPAA